MQADLLDADRGDLSKMVVLMKMCTWHNTRFRCTDEGKYSQKDSEGNEWALLCNFHNGLLCRYLNSGKAKEILRAWVKASGGAKKLANKTTDSLFKGR